MKILFAEDDISLGKLLTGLLRKEGIAVTWVKDGLAAYDECYRDGYDVLVLDWMMPKLDGVRLCMRLRDESYQGKILLLTAKDALEDKVTGLNSGADDYLVKPFALPELLARLHALQRRQANYAAESKTYGAITLVDGDCTLCYKNERVQLRPREYKVLEVLLRNNSIVVPREVLLERVWGIDGDITDNNLDVHIRSIRRKLEEIGCNGLISTVRGIGYMAEAKNV